MDDKVLQTLTKIIKDEVSKPLDDFRAETRSNFENVFGRLENVEQELTAQGSKIDRVEKDVNVLKTDMSEVKDRLSNVESDLSEVKGTVNTIDARLSGVEKKVA